MFLYSILFFIVGSLGSLFFIKSDRGANLFGNIFAVLASGSGLLSSLQILVDSSKSFSLSLVTLIPGLSISINVDALSAFFIFIISIVTIPVTIYGAGYIKHFYGIHNIALLEFLYNAFLLGMILVVSANNAIFFLIAWEIMSVSSYFMIVYENDEEKNVEAGSLYFVMTHIGTAFITLAFLVLYKATGSFDFNIIRESTATFSPLVTTSIFVLALIGFGTKAGMIPFHIWLPNAHPAAPSHVSALMSGLMIKTGIYMMIRIFLELMPINSPLLGSIIMVLGSISAVLGILYALFERDIKRLLAYSSIENSGLIITTLGAAIIFSSLGLKTLATLAMVASLFHILNHSLFKSLLFLTAGQVISETHTRDIDRLGGLIKYMPKIAGLFFLGSAAISALPPLNGFFSEWLILQSLFSGMVYSGNFYNWVFVLAGSALALAGSIALATFTKAFGLTFLGRQHGGTAKLEVKDSLLEKIGMYTLAILTLAAGIFSGSIVALVQKIVINLPVLNSETTAIYSTPQSISLSSGFSSLSVSGIFLSLIIVTLTVIVLAKIFTRNKKEIVGRTWDCGTELSPRMEMTSLGFSRSIITFFSALSRPEKRVEEDANGMTVTVTLDNIYDRLIYKPIYEASSFASQIFKKIQNGSTGLYILYTMLILVIFLTVLI